MVTTSKSGKEFKSLGASNNNSEVPNLVQVLQTSFDWFTSAGIKELLNEVSPVEDFSGGRFELKFISHEVKKPDLETMLEDERNCRKHEITFS